MAERLLPIPEAARILGVPTESLRRAADCHGKTIRIGRAVRLHPKDLEELIELCRVPQKEPAFTSAKTPANGSSSTARSSAERARQTAERLRRSSRATSSTEDAQPVPLNLTR
ncbi:helix-turn-helix domain-containing protein [Rhodovulum sulfidophilum]|uniref:helix-turn-helix domain-containing protein n=1 Tax=Rhodovulum sulfidophilum TaxID=35806 RepID=UPI001F473C29|nr:helix-turn-helix domain-containing protein [Rhodovulum sulfidophilum]MCE8438887.1 helix-turn-helix domain-containing protein [Rhodovulum sulfidophilum]